MLNFAQGVSVAVNIYFYIILLKFLLDMVGAGHNRFTSIVNRLVDPYLSLVYSMCKGIMTLYAPLLALLFILWLELFLPGFIEIILYSETSGIVDTNNVVLLPALGKLLLYSSLRVLESAAFFFSLLSLLYFIFTLGRAPLNNAIVSSIMVMVEPLLSPFRKIIPCRNPDISPLVLSAVLFLLVLYL